MAGCRAVRPEFFRRLADPYWRSDRTAKGFTKNVNEHAQAMGRMGRGVKKTLTQAERDRRSERLAVARLSRWKDRKVIAPDLTRIGERVDIHG